MVSITRFIGIALLVFQISFCFSCKKNDQPTSNVAMKFPKGYNEPVKGVWLTNVASDALFSRNNIVTAVEKCKKLGINTIFVVTLNDGYTMYRSQVMQDFLGHEIDPALDPENTGRDPLQEVIEEAHKRDIKVFAWFEFGFSSSYNAQGGAILKARPAWKCVTASGELCVKNKFDWMNALDPDVQKFVSSLLFEVIDNYEIDGIQGDDRLPAMPSMGGYDPKTIDLYKKEHSGQDPPKDHKDPDWVDWRAKKLNMFLKDLYQNIKEKDPDCIVSMSPSVYPWSKTEYLQDWPTWLEQGYVDMICPQVYRKDSTSYKNTLESTLALIPNDKKHLFYPGLLIKATGAKSPSQELLNYMIRCNRDHGIKGEVFFYYEGLKQYQWD